MSRIVIDENRCKGCGLCTTVCSFDLIRIADHFNAKGYRPAESVENCPAKCIGCANCAAMCPDIAITVYRTRSGAQKPVGTHTSELITQNMGHPAEQQHNKGNGQDRQPIQADTLHPNAPERR